MNYRKLLLLVVIMVVAALIAVTVWFAIVPNMTNTSPSVSIDDLTASGEIYDFSDAKVYTYHESVESVMKPAVTISENDKTFHFSYSMYSSYMPRGNYIEKNGRLILDCGDGNIFTFMKNDDDTLTFIQSESSPIPKYRYSADDFTGLSPVPDGAVFTRMGFVEVSEE